MKNIMLKIWVLILFSGCTLASRETFDLEYQDPFIMNTLTKGSLKSIDKDGLFNQYNHDIWTFNKETMEVSISRMTSSRESTPEIYRVEIIQDISVTEGILRLYGDGIYNNKYLGVDILVNNAGFYARFSIQDVEEKALENAKEKPFYEYVLDPIIFRIHKQHKDDTIVSLDGDEFFDDKNYNYYIPRINPSGEYILEQGIVTTDPSTGRVTTNTGQDIKLLSTTVIPVDLEIFQVERSGTEEYLAVVYQNEAGRNKIKLAFATTQEQAIIDVRALPKYTYELEETADRPNTVIRKINGRTMVLLSTEDKIGMGWENDGKYYWEKTHELTFNSDEMTLEVISTLSAISFRPDTIGYEPIGITNRASYKLKMLKDRGEKSGVLEGIFRLTGDRLFNNKIVGVRVKEVSEADQGLADPPRNPANILPKYRADFIFQDPDPSGLEQSLLNMNTALEDLITREQLIYQDKETVLRPYRLAEEMNSIGNEWVSLNLNNQGSMVYDALNTEVFEFIRKAGGTDTSERKLKYTELINSRSTESYYKVVVALDVNNTNGVFQLIGYDRTFGTIQTSAPLHNKFVAMDRGSEINQTQAKFAKGNSIEGVLTALRGVPLFNLYEKVSLPSAFIVINQMSKSGKWVAVRYGTGIPGDPQVTTPNLVVDYSQACTVLYEFNTSIAIGTPEVTVKETRLGISSGLPVRYKFDATVLQQVSDTEAFYTLKVIEGTPPLNSIASLVGKVLGIHLGSGNDGNKAFFVIADSLSDAITKLQNYKNSKRYTHYSEATAPVGSAVLRKIGGKQYIEYQYNPIAPFPVPNGNVTPYATRYITFNSDTLTMTVNTLTGNDVGRGNSQNYSIRMREDHGAYKGIFQVTGSVGSPLNGDFIRLDVQEGDPASGLERDSEGNAIRMLISDDINDLADGASGVDTVRDVLEEKYTSLRLYETVNKDFAKTAVEEVFNKANTWASVDATDKKYDYRNNRTVELSDPGANPVITVTIEDYDSGTKQNAMYTLELMENNVTGSDYDFVGRLEGQTGNYIGQYIAIKNAIPTTVGNSGVTAAEGHRIVIANTFNGAKTSLSTTGDAYITPIPWIGDMLDAVDKEYQKGTPSFVLMKGGVYNSSDTETWLFTVNTTTTNLKVVHETSGKEATYNIYMEKATTFDTTTGKRDASLFYLRDSVAEGSGGTTPLGDYHQKYVHIKDATIDSVLQRTKFEATIHMDQTQAESGSGNRDMRDLASVTINAGVIDTVAGLGEWMKLNNAYQLNKDDTEKWEFNVSVSGSVAPQIKITRQQLGTPSVEEYYNYTATANESSDKGVIQIISPIAPGIVPGVYNYKFVAIEVGVGTPGSADRNSVKLAIEDTTPQAIVARAALPEWNFRTKARAELSFTGLSSIDTEGILKLTLNTSTSEYEYDSAVTERMVFTALTSPIDNIAGSEVLDILISDSATMPTDRHGVKLLTVGANRVSFQIFRASGSRSNTFVQLEMGQGVDEGLIRLGTGNSIEDASSAFELIGDKFNYAYYSRATADWGVLEKMQTEGQWSLQRKDSTVSKDIIVGSAIVSDSLGHIVVGADGSGKPTYDPINTINVSFTTSSSTKIMRIDNFRSSTDLDGTTRPVFSYGLIPIEDVTGSSQLKGIYQATGFGEYGDQFIYLELAENVIAGSPNTAKRAKMSIASRIDDVKATNGAINSIKYNIFVTEWIKATQAFMEKAETLNSIVTVDPVASGIPTPNTLLILDKRDYKEWYFTSTTPTIGSKLFTLSITDMVNGVSSRETFGLISIKDCGDKGIFQITSGSKSGKYYTIAVDKVSVPNKMYMKEVSYNADQAQVLAELVSINLTASPPTIPSGFEAMYAKSEIVPNPINVNIVDKIIAQNDIIVTYDQDAIYTEKDAKEIRVDPSQNIINIIEQTSSGSSSESYFLNEMNDMSTARDYDTELFYLKGTDPAYKYNNHLLAIRVRNSATDFTKKKDYGCLMITNIVGANALTTNEIDILYIEAPYQISLKEIIRKENKILNQIALTAGNEGMSTVHFDKDTYYFDPSNFHHAIWDMKNRTVLYSINTASLVSTNFARIQVEEFLVSGPDYNVAKHGEYIRMLFVKNTRDDINFLDTGLMTRSTDAIATSSTGFNTGPTGTGEGDALGITLLKGSLGQRVGGTQRFCTIGITANPNNTVSFFWGLGRTANQSFNNMTGNDPKIVKLSLVKNLPTVFERMEEVLDGGSFVSIIPDNRHNWFVPIDINGDLDTSKPSIRPHRRVAAGSGVKAVYNINFATVAEDPANNKIVLTDMNPMFTYIYETGGERDVIIPHGTNMGNSWQGKVTNKYIPMVIGERINENFAKMCIRDTLTDLNRPLPAFWNYVSKKTYDSRATMITNLDKRGATKLTWVQFESPTSTPLPYNPLNTTNWSFSSDFSALTKLSVIVDTITTTVDPSTSISTTRSSPITYILTMIEEINDYKGIFKLEGVSWLDNKFIYIDNSATGNDKAKIAIADTIAEVKAAMLRITGSNLYRRDQITQLAPVMQQVITLHQDKKIGLGRYIKTNTGSTPMGAFYMDNRDSRRHTFSLDRNLEPLMTVETIKDGVLASATYRLILDTENPGDTRATYKMEGLTGTEPEHDQYLGIKFDNIDPSVLNTDSFKIVVTGRLKKDYDPNANDSDVVNKAGLMTFLNATSTLENASQIDIFPDNRNALNQWEAMYITEYLGSSAIFDNNNVQSFTIKDNILKIDKNSGGIRVVLEYNVIIIKDYSTDDKSLLYLDGIDRIASNDIEYQGKFLAIEIINDGGGNSSLYDKMLAGFGDDIDIAESSNIFLKDRVGLGMTHGYWNIEKSDFVNINSDFIKQLEVIASRRGIQSTVMDTILDPTLSTEYFEGLVFLADPRLFKASASSTSRVRIDSKQNGNTGGYYDKYDTYHMTLDTGSPLNRKLKITRIFTNNAGIIDIINPTFVTFGIKILKYDSLTSVVIQLISGTDPAGNLFSNTDPELNAMFRNKVLAIELGPNGRETDNIQIGFATPNGISRANINTAITEAEADLEARLNHPFKKNIPTVIPRALAEEQQRIFSILNVNSSFLGTILDPDTKQESKKLPFFKDNHLPLIQIKSNNIVNGDYHGSGSSYYASVGLKNELYINQSGTLNNEDRLSHTVTYLLRIIKNIDQTTGIFKFYRPVPTGVTTSDLMTKSLWKEELFEGKYHGFKQGTGANMFNYIWVYGNSVREVETELKNNPFFNGVTTWIASEFRQNKIKFFHWTVNAMDPTTPVAVTWVQAYQAEGTYSGKTVVFDPYLTPTQTREWQFFQMTVGSRVLNLVSVEEPDGRIVTYEAVMKDGPGDQKTILGLTGGLGGSFNDHYLFMQRLNNTQVRMVLNKPEGTTSIETFNNAQTWMHSRNDTVRNAIQK